MYIFCDIRPTARVEPQLLIKNLVFNIRPSSGGHKALNCLPVLSSALRHYSDSECRAEGSLQVKTNMKEDVLNVPLSQANELLTTEREL